MLRNLGSQPGNGSSKLLHIQLLAVTLHLPYLLPRSTQVSANIMHMHTVYKGYVFTPGWLLKFQDTDNRCILLCYPHNM